MSINAFYYIQIAGQVMMQFSYLFTLGYSLAALSHATILPSTNVAEVCRDPPKRLEWYDIERYVQLFV